MITRHSFAALFALLASVFPASALIVPFTEDFTSSNASWATGNSSVAAGWSPTGGVDDGGFITSSGTVATSGFGAIVFRGNAATNASGGAFVGNWIGGGVTTFSAYIWHDAPVALNFYARLDAGAGRAGSSIDFSVPSSNWFQLEVPLVDAPTSFQSYGAGSFTSVFTNIQNVQIALSTNQTPGIVGQVVNVGLDRVSVVPEPSTWALLLFSAGCLVFSVLPRRATEAVRI